MTDNNNQHGVSSANLGSQNCVPCSGKIEVLEAAEVAQYLAELNNGWVLDKAGTAISRNFKVKGFAKAVYVSNLCVWLADSQGHHPDVSFGWGYCTVTLTTHDVNGLTLNDFVWAVKLDQLIDNVA